MSNAYEDQSNSFLVGFTWGLIAGAAGYFLFGTDQGKKVRHQLAEEWDQHLTPLTEGSPSEGKISLRQAVVNFVQDLTTDSEATQTPKSSPKKSDSKSKSTPKSKKFKGV